MPTAAVDIGHTRDVVTAPLPELSLGEWATLALLREEPTHGWAIVKLLAPAGEVGSVWSLSRPLVYRAVDHLGAMGLVAPLGVQQMGARSRTLHTATRAGTRAVDRWLGVPVDHVRDVRTELLLKLVLRERRGLDLVPLVKAQQRRLGRTLARLERGDNADVVALWRSESASSVRRFLEEVEARAKVSQPGS
jgi:DNA-binding PadR family transcriptional regulator